MKATFVAVIVAAIGIVPAVQAQSMVEYSHVSSPSAGTALSAPTGAINRALQKTAKRSGGATHTAAIWEAKPTRGKEQPPAKPAPPAVFILANGERLESSNYFLTSDSLQVEQGETQRTIPMAKVNVNATLAANHQRGINLKIPANTHQITLGF